MARRIIHVDMDAFYASVEMRDNPALRGKPLIIGALPRERGVVATASYEARKYGVHSAMNIREAYRLCPSGIYMHPDFEKYRAVSGKLHGIWDSFATATESIALDEAYLDVTDNTRSWEDACRMAREIKRRTLEELHLTCSVGVAYSKTAAKMASEEKKPDGYFEIPTPEDFVNLILERDVEVLYTVGKKTAEKLHYAGIRTVRDLRQRQEEVVRLLGKQGQWLVRVAMGDDDREVTEYRPEEAKSISRELTFQEDTDNRAFLREVMLLLAISVERRAGDVQLYGEGVSLKITRGDMKSISRSKMVPATRSASVIWQEACKLLDQVSPGPVRLVGVGLYHMTGEEGRQLTMDDFLPQARERQKEVIQEGLMRLGEHYGLDFAGNLDRIFQGERLYRTVEYMRTHM